MPSFNEAVSGEFSKLYITIKKEIVCTYSSKNLDKGTS